VKNLFSRFDREKLRRQFVTAKPVPFIVIDNFLPADRAKAALEAYPDFDAALGLGKTFTTVNERKKVQISDSTKFSGPITELNEALASHDFLSDLAYITNIPNLVADEQLVGGGIHITGAGGRLDVHVDFNYIEDRQLHRRLNLLLYLNEAWQREWGGQFQLWDKEVKNCEATFDPTFNRCVIFETNEVSFHGVIPVSPSAASPRRSFATYYYTKEAPAHWAGLSHNTIFKARPEEKMKGMVLMPAEMAGSGLRAGVQRAKQQIKRLLGR
jgi:Rps23 Pro-64 3,4-dihydroxylase Tpa1-like proline 4-hydroxylase